MGLRSSFDLRFRHTRAWATVFQSTVPKSFFHPWHVHAQCRWESPGWESSPWALPTSPLSSAVPCLQGARHADSALVTLQIIAVCCQMSQSDSLRYNSAFRFCMSKRLDFRMSKWAIQQMCKSGEYVKVVTHRWKFFCSDGEKSRGLEILFFWMEIFFAVMEKKVEASRFYFF